MLGKYLSALRLCVVILFFCSVDLLDDGANEFNSEKINGDRVLWTKPKYIGVNIYLEKYVKNQLFFFMDRKVMGTLLFS